MNSPFDYTAILTFDPLPDSRLYPWRVERRGFRTYWFNSELAAREWAAKTGYRIVEDLR